MIRMIRRMLPALTGFSVLFLVIAVALVSRHAVHAQVSMKVTGLPDKGLILIGPADPGFEDIAGSVLKGRNDFTYESLKPYSVALQNKTHRTVVAYSIRWEYPAPNGKTGIWDQSFGQPSGLLDGTKRKTDPSVDKGGLTIAPGEWKLITPKSYIGSESRVTSEAEVANQGYRAYLQSVASQLSHGELTVTLDGAFFNDGTFVGPDRTGYFEIFKAEVTAKHDLLIRVVNASKAGQGLAQVASEIESSLPASRQDDPRPGTTPAEHYQYYKNFYAREFLGVRNKLGDQAALGLAYYHSFEHPPVLVKKD
jgi:hypothetical protein